VTGLYLPMPAFAEGDKELLRLKLISCFRIPEVGPDDVVVAGFRSDVVDAAVLVDRETLIDDVGSDRPTICLIVIGVLLQHPVFNLPQHHRVEF
jgi:hypothetical protein